MWYTVLVALDVVLMWLLTSAVLSVLPAWPLLPLPLGLTAVWALLPRAFLVGLYYSVRLPPARWFRRLTVWAAVRADWELPAPRPGPTMYVVAPHSIYAEHVAFGMVLNPAFEDVTVLCTSLLFWLPIARELASLAGARPATSAEIRRLLAEGRSVIITPEGMRGALHVNEPGGWARVWRGIPGECQPRKGWAGLAVAAAETRPALRVVPVFVSGTQALYRTWLPWPALQRWLLERFWYPWPILNWGRWGFWPRAAKLRFRFGQPLEALHVEQLFAETLATLEGLAKKE